MTTTITAPVTRTCGVAGCGKPPRRGASEWCKMHYHRWYRHGSVDKVSTGTLTSKPPGRGYKSVSAPSHQLAPPCGRVYVHRLVLFDALGPGSHPCHWCGRMVDWFLPVHHPDFLEVDHLNGVRDDNRRENLVVSCRGDNAGRGGRARYEALLAEGYWSNHDTVAALSTPGRRPVIQARTAS